MPSSSSPWLILDYSLFDSIHKINIEKLCRWIILLVMVNQLFAGFNFFRCLGHDYLLCKGHLIDKYDPFVMIYQWLTMCFRSVWRIQCFVLKVIKYVVPFILTQIGTGFKDEDLERHHTFLKEHVIEKPKSYYRQVFFNELHVYTVSLHVKINEVLFCYIIS